MLAGGDMMSHGLSIKLSAVVRWLCYVVIKAAAEVAGDMAALGLKLLMGCLCSECIVIGCNLFSSIPCRSPYARASSSSL